MGMKFFSEGSVTPPNPNPSNFIILSSKNYGGIVVMKVKYPGCTPYGGVKILVYTEDALRNQDGKLDPHFLENDCSPIARFPASKEGMEDAVNYARRKARSS